MKSPAELLQNTVTAPIYKLFKKYIGPIRLKHYCNDFANFVFKHCEETALVMLFFNAVSIISSHISQIGGLRRSKRENKDYLIKQEEKELWLDIGLTIIPPFLINNFLDKKIESGMITTREAREKMINTIAPVVGASRDDLYNTKNMKSFKETSVLLLTKLTSAILSKKKPSKKMPLLEAFDKKLKSTLPDYALQFNEQHLLQITTDFQDMVKNDRVDKEILKTLRNKSAVDDLYNQKTGLIILATTAYTILASNVIMPILKNKLANRAYEKELAAKGETKESIKRKKRFGYTKIPLPDDNENLFNDFYLSDTGGISGKQEKIYNIEKQKKPDKEISPFSTFEKYNTCISQSKGLRI